MALTRLLNIVLLLLMVCAVAGFLSIHAEMTAAASAAQGHEGLISSGNASQPIALVAELVPEGDELVILPEIPDMLVRNAQGVSGIAGTCEVESGKLYTRRDLRRQRIWLFAVIADQRPTVAVRRQPGR